MTAPTITPGPVERMRAAMVATWPFIGAEDPAALRIISQALTDLPEADARRADAGIAAGRQAGLGEAAACLQQDMDARSSDPELEREWAALANAWHKLTALAKLEPPK